MLIPGLGTLINFNSKKPESLVMGLISAYFFQLSSDQDQTIQEGNSNYQDTIQSLRPTLKKGEVNIININIGRCERVRVWDIDLIEAPYFSRKGKKGK